MRKEKFSIRKFTVGTASVLVGAALLAGGVNADVNPVSADSVEVTDKAYDSKEEAEAVAKTLGKGYTIEEFGGKFYIKLDFNQPAPEVDQAAQALADAKAQAIDAIVKAGVTADLYKEQINKAKTVEGVNALRDEILAAVQNQKAQELADAKEAAIKAIEEAGVTSPLYKDLINKAKTVEGVNALRDEILKAAPQDEVDHAKVLAETAFDNEKDAILAGYAHLQNKDKNKAGHTGFEVKEFGGKYYVVLNFDGVAPALPVEPGQPDEDVDHAEVLAKTPFDTKEAAEKAAEDYLNDPAKNVKGHKGYEVKEFGGKYYVVLSFNENVDPEAPGKDEDDAEDVDYAAQLAETAFDSKEAAEKAVKDYLNDPTKNVKGHKGYTIKEFGGKFYVELSFNENEKPEAPGKDEDDNKGKDPETKPGKDGEVDGEGEGQAPGKDGKDNNKDGKDKAKDKKDGKKDGKKLPNTGEAQSGLLASAAALLGAAGLFLVGRRKKAEK